MSDPSQTVAVSPYYVREDDVIMWCGQAVTVESVRRGLSSRKPSHWFTVQAMGRDGIRRVKTLHWFDTETMMKVSS